jgi:hypothetical protein
MQLMQRAVQLATATAVFCATLGHARGQQIDPPRPGQDAISVLPAQSPSRLSVRAGSDVGAYADSDHVYVLTPSVSGEVADPIAGWSVGGQYLVDAVSAASVDIVSTASRRWQEIRQAGTLDASYKPGALGVAASGTVSVEPDYAAWSAGAAATQDVLDQNATLFLALRHGHDVAGRTGTPFSVFARRLDRESAEAAFTFVVDRSTIASFVFDAVIEHGDPSKPYRYVPLFAPGTSVALGASVDDVNRLRVSARPLEQLPLSRDRFALSFRLAHRFSASTLRFDQRLYADTWALAATTSDGRYLIDLGRRVELGPHVRVHAQDAVAFWQRAYVLRPGYDYPALRTGDRELGPLVGVTLGWTFRFGLGGASNPSAWQLGWDMNLTETRYLDDLYIKNRLSALGVVSIEAQL